jgi:hypothetical protein
MILTPNGLICNIRLPIIFNGGKGMSINFSCPECGVDLVAAEIHVGNRVRCNNCRALIIVPASAEPPTPALPDTDSARSLVEEAAEAVRDAAAPQGGIEIIRIPEYYGVKYIGTIIALQGYAIIALSVVFGLFVMVAGLSEDGEKRIAYILLSLALLFYGVSWGFIVVGIGQLFYCMRDIAQNTFFLRRLGRS